MKKQQENRAGRRRGWLRWALACAGALLAAVGIVYYWRVFYEFGEIAALPLTLITCTAALAGVGAVWLVLHFAKTFPARAALAVFLCGVCFCFANPPMQAPDEGSHFLRAYAISEGHFDFDAARTYPDDVNALMTCFPGAWVNGNTTYWLTTDKSGAVSGGGSSADFAIKQVNGERIGLGERFAVYRQMCAEGNAPATYEPQELQLLPYLHQALFMAAARLLGFGALGCFYAGRLANLCAYALLCWLALKNCRRYSGVFLAMALLPMSLYIAASCNYDALMLGFYYLTVSYYCVDELRDRDLALFAVAFVMVNAVKPWINLLWIVVPLILPARVWKARVKKGQIAALAAVLAVGAILAVEWYGRTFRANFTDGRMLGETVSMSGQLGFVLHHIPRTAMVFLGTLYENALYLGKLGTFGALDLNIPLIGLLSPVVLMLSAALSAHERSSLTPRSAAGLGLLTLTYTAGVLAAQYITYTPVGMVRVLGVQTRYLLPAFLMLFVLMAALLSRVLEPARPGSAGARSLCLAVCVGFALLSALLLAQHYYIGPVCIVPAG